MTSSAHFLRVATLAGFVLLTGSTIMAQDVVDEPGFSSIQNEQPAFMVRAELNHKTGSYREGDELALRVISEVDAYVYLLYQQADGEVFQIFPNHLQPNNYLRAHDAVSVPADKDLFRWEIGAPFGKETIKVIGSREPIEELSDPALRRRMFNPVGSKDLKGVELEISDQRPADWAEYELSLHTYSSASSDLDTSHNRFGVFFGVSHYRFNSEWERANKKKLNVPTCHRDANVLADLMREVGQLKDSRVYTNRLATRQQFEDTMTKWLPSVSKPGDTVFVFFSGHGMRIEDNNQDESDNFDELIVTHDTASLAIVGELLKQKKAGTITPDQDYHLGKLLRMVRSSPAKTPSEIDQLLLRETSVSDDRFGHWLQSLDGRRVVVILNMCHAGGFSSQDKGTESAATRRFDFLDQEVTRLKDLGQRDTVLFASSSSDRVSYFRSDSFPRDLGPFSVLSSYLIESLKQSDGPVSLQGSYEFSKAGMADYFKARSRTGHQPYLFGSGFEEIYLKP